MVTEKGHTLRVHTWQVWFDSKELLCDCSDVIHMNVCETSVHFVNESYDKKRYEVQALLSLCA